MTVYRIASSSLVHHRAVPMLLENISLRTFDRETVLESVRASFLSECLPDLPEDVRSNLAKGKLTFDVQEDATLVDTDKKVEKVEKPNVRFHVYVVMSEGKNGGVAAVFWDEQDAEEWIDNQIDDIQYSMFRQSVM